MFLPGELKRFQIKGLKLIRWEENEKDVLVYQTLQHAAELRILKIEDYCQEEERPRCQGCPLQPVVIFGYGAEYPRQNQFFVSTEAAVKYIKENLEKIIKFFEWRKKSAI